MTSWRYNDSRWSERLAAPIKWNSKETLLAAAGVILVIVVAAVTVARGDSAREIAEDARVVTSSASVFSTAAILSGEVGQGVVVGQTAQLGGSPTEGAAESATRIRQAIVELEQRVATLAQVVDAGEVVTATDGVALHALAVADALERGDGDGAALIAESRLAAAMSEMVTSIEAVSQESADHIAAVDAGLGTMSTIARFVAALLVPALVVLVLYRVLRRSQKASLLKSELDRERELRHKMSSFVAAASHHIGAPLSAVASSADLLRRGSSDWNSSARQEVVGLLATGVDDIADVLADLSTSASHDLGDPGTEQDRIELRDVIESVTADWGAKQSMTLTLRGNAVVSGDEQRIAQALGNLVRNAVCSGGEKIEVEIKSARNQAVVEVIDDGAVIPEEVNDRISETYYSQGDDDGLAPWRGLALSVARRVARTMGGDLRYHREERANVFRMTLPAARTDVLPRHGHTRIVEPTKGMPTFGSIESVIARGGPGIVYQPIVDLSADESDEVVGYEALARFGSHSAAEWFGAASSLGLRTDLELACLEAALHHSPPPPRGGAFLAVSVSDPTLHDSRLEGALEDTGPGRVFLQLSGADPIPSYEATSRSIERLTVNGARLAIADFRFGDFDPEQMTRLGVEIIKIDKALVRTLPGSDQAQALVAGLTAMSDVLGMLVAAEGVATNEEHSRLVDLGVGLGQGPLYARPEPFGEHAAGGAYQAG